MTRSNSKQENSPSRTMYFLVAAFAFAGGYFFNLIQNTTTGVKKTEANRSDDSASAEQVDFARSNEVPIGNSPVLGPADAPVTIVAFSDFQCHFCRKGHKTIKKIRKNYPGSVRIVYKHYPLSKHKNARPAARAAIAAHQQGKFWEMHDRLLENQQNWEDDDVRKVTVEWTRDMGLDAGQFRRDFGKPKYSDLISRDKQLAKKLGVRATPGYLINGLKHIGTHSYAELKKIVDRQLKKADRLLENGVARKNLYSVLVARNRDGTGTGRGEAPGKTKQPEKVDPDLLKVGNSPVMGPEDAPVTVYEFSDFECPYCKKASETFKNVLNDYRGEVRVVFKNFPLSMHDDARSAARAALAAHRQDRFRKMYNLLFKNQNKLGRDGLYVTLARKAGLNVSRFKNDMNDPALNKQIEADVALGRNVGVRGTPYFLINGKPLSGSKPAATYRSHIESALND